MRLVADSLILSDTAWCMVQVQRGKASKCVAAMTHRAQASAWRQWTGRAAYRRLKLHAHHALRSRCCWEHAHSPRGTLERGSPVSTEGFQVCNKWRGRPACTVALVYCEFDATAAGIEAVSMALLSVQPLLKLHVAAGTCGMGGRGSRRRSGRSGWSVRRHSG